MDEGLYLSRNGAILRVTWHVPGIMFQLQDIGTGDTSVMGMAVAMLSLAKKLELPEIFDMLGVRVVEPRIVDASLHIRTIKYPRGTYTVFRMGHVWKVQYHSLEHDSWEDAQQWCERHYMTLVLKDIYVGLHD